MPDSERVCMLVLYVGQYDQYDKPRSLARHQSPCAISAGQCNLWKKGYALTVFERLISFKL